MKKKTQPIHEIIHYFATKFIETTGCSYTIVWGKDATLARKLLEFDDPLTIKKLIDRFFVETLPQYMAFGSFFNTINRLKAIQSRESATLEMPKSTFDKFGNYLEM